MPLIIVYKGKAYRTTAEPVASVLKVFKDEKKLKSWDSVTLHVTTDAGDIRYTYEGERIQGIIDDWEYGPGP